MPIELRNYQWELGGVVFGYDQPVEHLPTVTPSDYSIRSQDQPNPTSDGMSLGVDLIEPGVWQFQLFTNMDDEAGALAALEELKNAWRGDAYRKLPGKATALRYRFNDRTRIVYGRPRRFTAPLGPEYLSGRIDITADFQTVSELFFDDEEDDFEIGHVEPVTGGFVTPVTAPLSTEESAPSLPGAFVVGGAMPTPVEVDFVGPLDASGLLIDGEPFIRLQGDIPHGVTVTVDARPWVNAVTRQDGAGAAGLLSPRSRMPKMLLTPGEHSATLLGSSPTGTGKAIVRWRKAHPSI